MLQAFIGKITRNISLDAVKAVSAQKRGSGEAELVLDELLDITAGENKVEYLAEQHEILKAINDFLDGLPIKKRKIVVLRYWHCYSVPEISRIVGVSEINVSSILKRERKKLTEYLEKRGY